MKFILGIRKCIEVLSSSFWFPTLFRPGKVAAGLKCIKRFIWINQQRHLSALLLIFYFHFTNAHKPYFVRYLD